MAEDPIYNLANEPIFNLKDLADKRKSEKGAKKTEVSPFLLDSEQFRVHEEADERLKGLVTNDYAVQKGAEEVHLVSQNEQVVKFTGTGEQLLQFVRQVQETPVADVDLSPHTSRSSASEPIELKRTGVQMVISVGTNHKSTYIQPMIGQPTFGKEPSIEERWEIVGARKEGTSYHIYLMEGDSLTTDTGDYTRLSDSDQEKAAELDREQIDGKIDQVERFTEHPAVDKRYRATINTALEQGCIMSYSYRNKPSGGLVSHHFDHIELQARKPNYKQTITANNLNLVGIFISEEDIESKLPLLVVPEEIAAGL
jgi:Asp-tRNA(Asn)/Glu-tRNA(Gln) amidotransferase C subunit